MDSFDSFFARLLHKRIIETRDDNIKSVMTGLPPDQYHQRVGADRAYETVVRLMGEVVSDLNNPDQNKGNRQ